MEILTLPMKRLWNGRSPRPTSTAIGALAEERALKYLQRNGLCLIKRNYRCRFGEIDLVMADGACLVIVEVRSRDSVNFVAPALTVDERKQQKIANAALAFLSGAPQFRQWPVRFDVVAILRTANGPGAIQWIKDAFRV